MSLIIRPSQEREDDLITDNFYAMWQDYNMQTLLHDNWREDTLAFIKDARKRLEFSGFVAEKNDKVIGSAACQVFEGLYPMIFKPKVRKMAYIWAVYVMKGHRQQGVARQLTQACINYLKERGCTKIHLHASPMGKSVYEKLEFQTGNEMILEIPDESKPQ